MIYHNLNNSNSEGAIFFLYYRRIIVLIGEVIAGKMKLNVMNDLNLH